MNAPLAAPPRATVAVRTIGTLLLAGVGGYGALLIGLPLPWMMGAMLAVAIAALARAGLGGHHVHMPAWPRLMMVPVIGVMLGSAFTPEIAAAIPHWWITMLGLLVYVALATALVYWLYRHLFGYDRPTAYFSAVPGGLIEMALIAETVGGNTRTIALIHFCRIVVAVLTIPFVMRWLYGPVGSGAIGFAHGFDLGARDAALLIACGVAGFFIARRLGLPAAPMTGPVAASAVVHATGLTGAHPPDVLVVAAQIVMGATLGARFLGYPVADVLRGLKAAISAGAIMLALTVAMALLMSLAVTEPLTGLVLAFAPGGLAEMSLIALSLKISVAFVTAHHVARIFMAVMFAPLAYRLIFGRTPGEAP